MTILSTTRPTLLDIAKSLDPDGSVAAIVEILAQTNEVLQDAVYAEGNLPTGHRTTTRTSLPQGTFRRFNAGVQPGKSTREQFTESCMMLEAYAEIDKAEADLNNNAAAFRANEAMAFLEGMSQQLAATIFYGNSVVNPERFTGFAPRYNSLSAANAENIINGGGVGVDNRSIWLVCWSEMNCFMMYPKGSQAGIKMTDKGEVTIENADGLGGRMEGYRTHFRVDAGLVIRDWRDVVRIANIDFSNLTPDASSGANLPRLMYQAINRLPNMGRGRCAFYMSRDIRTTFGQQLAEGTKNSSLITENVGGVIQSNWHGIPIRRVDQLAVDEATVV